MIGMSLSSLLLLIGFSSAAADPAPEFNLEAFARAADECGDPRAISQAYESFRGTVLEVTEGDTIVVKIEPLFPALPDLKALERPNPTTIQLVSIDAPRGSGAAAHRARAELASMVLGKNVAILVSPVQNTKSSLAGMVDVADVDVAKELLAKGLVKYRYGGPYAIDWWMECHYKLAETHAKAARVGIWAEP